jgi:hypothetical protein
MALFKNEIPILEFDTEQNAVIMLEHHFDYNFPHKAVMLFMEPEIDDFVANNECASMAACAKMRGVLSLQQQ